MTEDIIKGLNIEDLPKSYREVAREMGLEATLKLAELFGGQNVYYPKLDAILRLKRDNQICAEFNGSNFTKLGRKYKLSTQQIRNILSGKKRKH